MKNNYILLIINILLFYCNCLDNSTLSNYKDIVLAELTGVFTPDFDKEIINGTLNYTFTALKNGSEILLDARYLEINSIKKYEENETKELEFKYGEPHKLYGRPLVISCNYTENETIIINIDYETTKNGTAAQFLKKEQTVGKEYPFLLTISEMTLGRELLPSQDTPAVKFPFYLGMKVKNPIRGMISGLYQENITEENNMTTYYYNQSIPVPNYLIALAAGRIEEQIISENVSVFAEPEILDKSAKELDEMPKVLEIAIKQNGPYEWGKYNILILPASFPYSAMENPCLTFASSCLINGDKSLFDIFVHELTHSWSGNLVTNENWRDFWLNEGITKYRQRQIVAEWKGSEDYPKMDAILGLYHIEEALDYLGRESNATCLRPNLDDVVPDSIYSDIPYEKGYNFMLYVENIVSKEVMNDFFKSYFQEFKYKSVDLFDFKNYFEEFCKNNSVSIDKLNSIDWNSWIYGAGPCPVPNDLNNSYLTEVEKELDKFIKGELDDELAKTFTNWTHTSKTVFFLKLEDRNEFLTEKQHEFLTKKLKLYENQNFLVTTYYFRLILGLTDKFYEHEKESLINYLKSYGVSDFMYGIYELFYRRDEEAAVKTLEESSSFYHSIMLNKAKKDIENAKNNFPIMTLDFNNTKPEQCLILSDVSKFDIISEEYKSFLNDVEISKGVVLKSGIKSIDLDCYLNSSNKYCQFKNENITEGEYKLEVKERIQNKTYAVKNHTSEKFIKIFNKLILDQEKLNIKTEIDFNSTPTETVTLPFLQISKEVYVYANNKVVPFKINGLNLQFDITKEICPVDTSDPSKNKLCEIYVMNGCKNDGYKISVNVKEEIKKEEPNYTLIFSIIGVVVFVIIVLAILFIVRAEMKRKQSNETTQLAKEMLGKE